MSPTTHMRASLWALAAFLAMGMWLEAMFGLRVSGVIDDPLRREFLRLGHAHGGILALVNLALAWALQRLGTPAAWAMRVRLAAWVGAVAVGVGFVGGGLWHGPTDPGPLVLIVPAGALMLVASLVATAMLRREDHGAAQSNPGSSS